VCRVFRRSHVPPRAYQPSAAVCLLLLRSPVRCGYPEFCLQEGVDLGRRVRIDLMPSRYRAWWWRQPPIFR